MRSLMLVPILAASVGCASITGTTLQSVSVQTIDKEKKEVTGCACELVNNKGKWFVTTPGSVSINRSNDDLMVTCKKEGYDPGRVSAVSDTKGSMFGNILLGGGIGAIVDHNSGAAYEYPNLLQVELGSTRKIESKPDTQQASRCAEGNTTC